MHYQTDKEIKDEADGLLKECLEWVNKNFPDFSDESRRSIGITRFLYLKDKVLNHSPKFYREQDLLKKGKGGTCEVKNV